MKEIQETRVRSLNQEDPLEEEMATYYSILVGKSHRQRSLAGYSPWGRKELDMTEWLNTHTHTHTHTYIWKHRLFLNQCTDTSENFTNLMLEITNLVLEKTKTFVFYQHSFSKKTSQLTGQSEHALKSQWIWEACQPKFHAHACTCAFTHTHTQSPTVYFVECHKMATRKRHPLEAWDLCLICSCLTLASGRW